MKFSFLLFWLLSMTARANTIYLGSLSFDTFIPASGTAVGVNAFDVANLTGLFSLPDDFPVADSLTFQSATIRLFSAGQADEVFPLPDIGPGFLADQNGNPVVQVSADQIFQKAELTFTLSVTRFLLSNGTMVDVGGNFVDVVMHPSAGPNLTVDVDQTLITPTPEPAGWALTVAAFACILGRCHFQHSQPRERI